MLISIITINYNNARGLRQTVESVFNQTFKEFEYIVIDGGSTDGSEQVIQEYINKFDYCISEPDTGIYNAMNKGIKVAKGQYLLFLNSGDWLINQEVLQQVIPNLNPEYAIYYGDVVRVYNNKKLVTKTYPKTLSFSFFVNSALPHQATFINRDLFETIFYYNEEYKICSDWEFLIYAICKVNVPYKKMDIVISNFVMNGVSNQISGKKLIEVERLKTYQKYFPLFIDDYIMHNNKTKEKENNVNRFERAAYLLKRALKIIIKG
ncbi:glycosyltransferase family 2 protein [Aestuariibaculum sediminum]|uniref:Glycosyltransferase n=1 Tax=Aestuariibaculum sediminum TaxID=2770637 RepID=A0A8J6U9F1_9FLAO|nr:glycosyltransferase family 2 protein [Aestuariibaculum sediminum]MBD0833087.1 glycosyltransferase [Aestuariibaculum sediminum]